MNTQEIPYGYCHCGCGQKTAIAKQTDRKWGIVAGEPVRYIRGHGNRIRDSLPNPNPSGLCMCGCGRATPIARATRTYLGHVKGCPTPYFAGHTSRMSLTVEEKFWKYVNKRGPDECWEWQGATTSGYGMFAPQMHLSSLAHRYSYELHNGPIPEGMFVCHTCDNRPCVNPKHLWLGTLQDNHADMVQKGRHKPFGGKLSVEQVIEIRQLYAAGATQRQICEQFGIGQSAASCIALRKTWKHI